MTDIALLDLDVEGRPGPAQLVFRRQLAPVRVAVDDPQRPALAEPAVAAVPAQADDPVEPPQLGAGDLARIPVERHQGDALAGAAHRGDQALQARRSEDPTYELQSLMRNSYDVC